MPQRDIKSRLDKIFVLKDTKILFINLQFKVLALNASAGTDSTQVSVTLR